MATPSYTPLPPSPELRPNGSHLSPDNMDPLPFSLGGINLNGNGTIVDSDLSTPSRLRSIARYQAFSPQALACSDPILPLSFSGTSNNSNSNGNNNSTENNNNGGNGGNGGRAFLQANSNSRRQQRSPQSASLGAVAGAQGVAVFRISKPHEPLLMLNHATSNIHAHNDNNNNNNGKHIVHGSIGKTTNSPRNQQHPQQPSQGGGGRPVTALAFQPDATRSMYLAAARGSGVLIWDVSGHSISPLLGRLAMDASVGGSGTGHIYAAGSDYSVTSLSWKASAERDGVPLLATTTNYSACIWDLRSPVATVKPSVRFGVKTKKVNSSGSSSSNSGAASPYVQIACSRSNECAALDAAGTVRVFDIRMTDQTRYSMNSLATFAAFAHRGVGISSLPALHAGAGEGRSTNWVTWGLDSLDTDAVVKVWSSLSGNGEADPILKSDNSTHKTEETYWYMDGSPGRISGVSPYRLIAQCSPPYHLACSRVCPDPVENSIMTIGILDDNMGNTNERGHDGWRAELWKIKPPTTDEVDANDGTFGMERIVSFNGGAIHDASIESALGRNARIGQLQAAELAITSFPATGLQNIKGGDDRMQDRSQPELGLALALCCLSDKGFVTTHLVPEALPQKELSKLGPTSPQLFSNGNRTKVFNDDKEGAVDAALLWGTRGERPPRVGIETRTAAERVRTQHQQSPVKDISSQGTGSKQLKQRNSDSGMLFEMDVPAVAYGTAERIPGVQVGPIDLSSPKAVATAAMAEETINAAAHVRDVAAMAERMDNIETERIPCPRICSAVFGPGIGGLAVFKNGDVKKMWTWYDRASSSRVTGIPSSISAPETAFSDPGSSKGPGSAGNHDRELKTSIFRDYPRSMKDLMDMTEAASEAQWGGEANESGAADSQDEQEQSSNDNFFEYMSTGSISSDSDDNEPVNIDSEKRGSRYESYFGNFRRPLAVPGGNANQSEGDEQPRIGRAEFAVTNKLPVVGPSSDTLAPIVHVTHDFDKLALNNQSAELAEDWELGQWQTEDEAKVRLSSGTSAYLMPNYHLETLQEDGGMVDPQVSPTIQRGLPTGLPSYRRLTETPQKSSAISRSKSDSIITPVGPALKNGQIENEQGVHGGEYAVRPNMQESMVFLRKLFSHQQQQGNAFPSLLSPPDSPSSFQKKGKLLRNIAAIEQLRSQGEFSTRQSTIEASGPDEKRARAQPGVYALATDAFGFHEEDRKLSQIKTLCAHNASVCEKYGESGKQKVWLLFEQMVDRRLNEPPDAFNGWGGEGGGALGVELVANIMRYYETLGDVQMLATIVCVLSGGRPRNQDDQLHLLPTGSDEKYDTYIRRYSDLLFGWSLLVKRAELNKNLAQRVQENEGNNIVSDTAANRMRAPGIELVFTCPRCGEDAANICRSCQDFAFRCSVCENGVRGLFMVCDACGHGGHSGHINSWFSKHSECPSGCGCLCTFNSRAGPSSVKNDLPMMPTYRAPTRL